MQVSSHQSEHCCRCCNPFQSVLLWIQYSLATMQPVFKRKVCVSSSLKLSSWRRHFRNQICARMWIVVLCAMCNVRNIAQLQCVEVHWQASRDAPGKSCTAFSSSLPYMGQEASKIWSYLATDTLFRAQSSWKKTLEKKRIRWKRSDYYWEACSKHSKSWSPWSPESTDNFNVLQKDWPRTAKTISQSTRKLTIL